MKVIWAKIKIELDDICQLSLDNIKAIAEYANEQDSQYFSDYVELYTNFNKGTEIKNTED